MKLKHYLILLATVLTALIGGWLTAGGQNWYRTLRLPVWTPVGQAIGSIWTIIFVLTAVSALLVWGLPVIQKSGAPFVRRFLWVKILFGVNAILNVSWSFVFFNQHQIGLAVLAAGALGLTTYALFFLIYPMFRFAAVLLLPYVFWVTFAVYLNYVVWTLN